MREVDVAQQGRLQDLISAALATYTDLRCLEGTTFADMAERLAAIAHTWARLGLGAGDRVALHLSDRVAMVEHTLAALHLGAVPVLLHAYLSLETVQHCVGLVSARLYVGDTGQQLLTPNLAEAAPVVPGTALIASTSGTTGVPKLVQHSDAGVLANIQGILSYLPLKGGDRILILRDPSYLSVLVGEVLVGLARGCHLHMASPLLTPHSLLTRIAAAGANFVVSVPSLFNLALPTIRQRARELRALRCLLFTGEGATAQTIGELRQCLPSTEIFHCYGLTEAGPRLTYWSGDRLHPEESFCVGLPLPGVRIHAVDDHGAPLPPGTPGCLTVASPSMMLGYVGQQPQVDAWLLTSDWGWVDAGRHVYVQGRIDDIINRGGIKIAPATIEAVLLQHDAVLGAAVAGYSRGAYQVHIEGAVTLRTGKQETSEALLAWCRRHLPQVMWPQKIYIVSELPRKESGKLYRRGVLGLAP